MQSYSRSVAEQVKTIMNVSFRYVVTSKVISVSPVERVGLPKIETSRNGRCMKQTEIIERERFRIWIIFAVLLMTDQGVKDSIASIINNF